MSGVNLQSLWSDPREFARRNTSTIREGLIQNFESQLLRPDGSTLWCAESIRAEYDASGTVARFEGVAVDITERKRAQEDLMLARDAQRIESVQSRQHIVSERL